VRALACRVVPCFTSAQGTYDEFKAFVACAQDGLAPVGAGEMESLGKKNFGWSVATKSSLASIGGAPIQGAGHKRTAKKGTSAGDKKGAAALKASKVREAADARATIPTCGGHADA
jgi:hypothetical protein